MSLNQKEIERYSRQIILDEIGLEGQERLKIARVLMIGAGGLGCPVLQYLVAAGIGTLGIIDFDIVEESNLQRQILYSTEDIGKNKAIVAKKRLKQLNPHINIIAYPKPLNRQNALTLFPRYDLIIDGTDNFETRYIVNDVSLLTGKPFVYGAIHKFEGQVAVFNYEHGPSYRCLFPNPPEKDSIPSCSQMGVLGVLPGIVGAYQANEALKIILKIGEPLSGKLLLINSQTNFTSLITIQRSEREIENVLDGTIQTNQQTESIGCGEMPSEQCIMDISAKDLYHRLKNGEKIQFVDVRGLNEQPKIKMLERNKHAT